MSLSVAVGALAELTELDPAGADWLLDDLEAVNAVLRANGMPEHAEPEVLPPHASRSQIHSFPYWWLHTLRRLYALILNNEGQPGWQPAPMPADYSVDHDPLIEDELTVYMRSHLIVHSDSGGFYVPVDFEGPLVDTDDKLQGGILGSSQRLLAELRTIAPWLGIALDSSGSLDDASASRIRDVPDGDPWLEEKLTWLVLFEAARLSVELRSAIYFR